MKINHVTILVKDKKVSEKFFIETLGFHKKEDIGDHLWIVIGEQYIHITENSGEPVPNTFYHFAIEVDNLPDYIKELEQKGVEIFDVAENNVQCFLRDLDGNLIELVDKTNHFLK